MTSVLLPSFSTPADSIFCENYRIVKVLEDDGRIALAATTVAYDADWRELIPKWLPRLRMLMKRIGLTTPSWVFFWEGGCGLVI
jgi:hypothetical protein